MKKKNQEEEQQQKESEELAIEDISSDEEEAFTGIVPEDTKVRTDLGEKVNRGEVKDIDEILDKGYRIQEAWIVDALVPNLETDLLLIGQSKGKFGGGKRRVFKQTQKKTREGNKPRFATMAVVGNKNGYIGLGYGKAKETVPAREKAFRNAKLNLFKIRRGCGSWECGCGEPHSLPFCVEGKSSSVKVKLIPAPKGTGLCTEREIAKILEMAGVQDVWSKTLGQTRTKMNLIKATEKALRKLLKTKIHEKHIKVLSVVEGRVQKTEPEQPSEEIVENKSSKSKKEVKGKKKKK